MARLLRGLMRIVLTLLLLLAAITAEAGRVRVQGEPGLVLKEQGGRTVLHLPGGSVPLGRGGPCDPCALQGARLVGERPGAALILLVTYQSRPGTPGGMCGAGEEKVLNVVSLNPRPREAVGLPLSSCWNNVEASGAPSWNGREGLLTAERWTPTSGAAPERLTWRIDRDGRVAATERPSRNRH